MCEDWTTIFNNNKYYKTNVHSRKLPHEPNIHNNDDDDDDDDDDNNNDDDDNNTNNDNNYVYEDMQHDELQKQQRLQDKR